MKKHLLIVFALLVLLLTGGLVACSDDPELEADAGDVGEQVDDVGDQEDADVDPGDSDGDIGDGDSEPALERVELDFDEEFDAPGDGFLRAVQVDSEADLIDGEVAQGMMGDWLLENDHGRYLVGLGERAVGPCSWDGNPIETEAMMDGTGTDSVLGEVCLLINVGQTMRPEYAEILEDGSQGRAVVAVTGRIGTLDFLNVRNMVTDLAPGLYDSVQLDPERAPPLTVTVYYVLTPDSKSMRVLTAFRNDGDEKEYFVAAHLVLSGSTGSFFNPLSGRRGWGYDSLSGDNLTASPVSFVAYASRHAGYAFVPDPVDHLEGRLPMGGGMLAVSGVVAVLHGATNLLELLLATEAQMETMNGYIGLDPDEVTTVGYRLYPSDGSISTASDTIFSDLGVETNEVSGQVVDHDGQPMEGVMVTPLLDGDRSFTMSWTDEEGRFSMRIPHGEWEIRARDGSLFTSVDIEINGSDQELDDLVIEAPAEVEIRVRTPQGEPVPARVVVACEGGCGPERPTSRELDSRFSPPLGWLEIVEIGLDGDTTLRLPRGDYRISVNRGMTWTTWPQDATDTGGELISVTAGDEVELDAEIAEVIDTTGLLSADFHIHAMASPDSSTSDHARVVDFLAGGLDVMVSSDHDGVSDFQPTIDALGAGEHITSIVGNEITTSNIGHINAFPLERVENSRRGGAIDWSRDGGAHLTLQELVDITRENPGEQVIQLNHPHFPMGYIGLMQADVLTGQSFADRDLLRMPEGEVDESGDTGLWTDDFDAIELANGFGMSNYWSGFRWWLTMVGRGFSPTATAVSDTHGIYGSLGASPRSFVVVDEGMDTPAAMNLAHFIDRIKSGALLGTNGPMMRVELQNASGETAGLGGLIDGSDGTVTAHVTLELAPWVDVDTLDVYMNVPADELQGEPGEAVREHVNPTFSVPIEWDEQHRELVAEGTYQHHRLRQVVEVPLEISADSYVVFLARGLNGRTMRPVVSSSGRPLAFSNPVFIDFDGGGYDNPPLEQSRIERMAQRMIEGPVERSAPHRVIIERGEALTAEKIGQLLEAWQCDHGFSEGDISEVEDHGHSHTHGHTHGHTHHGQDHRHIDPGR